MLTSLSKTQTERMPFVHTPPQSLPVLAGLLLHFIYLYLLRMSLKLSARDARDLIEAGFDEQHLTRTRYRTVPSKIARLVVESEMNQYHHCGCIFYSGEGFRVPGFFFDGSRMRINAREGRLVVPVKDARTAIGALQIYRSARDDAPAWFDSGGLPRGARATRQPHFARPHLARESGEIVIAEHTLAADLHAWRNDEAVVALNGLLPDVFARTLRTSLPQVSVVAFAFSLPDIDLLRALETHGFEVYGQSLPEVA